MRGVYGFAGTFHAVFLNAVMRAREQAGFSAIITKSIGL
jgi:hypothetical protein